MNKDTFTTTQLLRSERIVPIVFLLLLIAPLQSMGDVLDDLILLRNQCLYYAVGHAPADTNTITLRHGLYSQSPFSAPGEVDLAASGFCLASLPAAVTSGIISSNAAREIAATAAQQVRHMIDRSAAAVTAEEIRRYGYRGMLCHYPVWDDTAGEFRAQAGVEFSSIDTTLLLFGLLVSADYFGGDVRVDFEAAQHTVRWRDWLDRSTPGHLNQFHMSYWPGVGYSSWWDWCTQEAMLVDIMASASDESIDPVAVWRAWRRDQQNYTSPGPDSKSFTCYTTYFGDPFTVLYGLAFLNFARLPLDVDHTDWFQMGRKSYLANTEFFKKERGYLDGLSSGFSICAPNGVMAKPNGKGAEPLIRADATIYTLAGALPYYGDAVASNTVAMTLSQLLHQTTNFLGWHGWPAASVNATNSTHPVVCDRIIGQDVAFIGLAIDNFLNHHTGNLILQDSAIRRVLGNIFPP